MSAAGKLLLRDQPAAGVLRLRLNRPQTRNALNAELVRELAAAIQRPEARALVLASSTPNSFCSGADLSLTDEQRAAVSDALYEVYGLMRRVAVPIVAAITGPAVGGGAQLAIASDLRVASPGGWLRVVGPAHGLAVGAWRLPALVGAGRAMDLCLTGRRVSADEALAMGLVDRVADDPIDAAVALAADIAMLDPDAVRRVKATVDLACDERALASEARGNRAWQGGIPPQRTRR